MAKKKGEKAFIGIAVFLMLASVFIPALALLIGQSPHGAATVTNNREEEQVQDVDELAIVDTTEGEGKVVKADDTVTIKYEGRLLDGTVFDSSGDDEITFPLGDLIQGWQEGIPGMKEGGKRTLSIPSRLGYGAAGQGSIPGGAGLEFDIELIKTER